MPQRVLCVLSIVAVAAMSLSAHAAVVPVYSQVYVEVGTHVDPNEDDQTDANHDDQLTPLIDPMSIGASASDSSEDEEGENQAYVDGNAAASWLDTAEGSAVLFATWQASTSKSFGDPDTGGGFYVDLLFEYTFQVDEPSLVTIHANITATGNSIFPFLSNNALEFDGDAQSINPSSITGIFDDTFEYSVGAGQYSLYYTGFPNVGTSYLDDDETMVVTIEFTITPDTDIPEPASASLLVGGLVMFAFRRRWHALSVAAR